MIVDALRSARSAGLWLAGPLDRLWLRARGRPQLPPLWLRRHTGPVGHFEASAREMAASLERLGLLRPSDTVLDVGCGAGAMVPEIARRLGPDGHFVGFDVHSPSIHWCRRRYSGDPRFRFELAGISSAYGSSSAQSETLRFPVADSGADLVLAKSLFTHLLEEDSRRTLAEIRRVLRPGRGAAVTAFLFDETHPSIAATRRAFPFEEYAGGARMRSRARPTAAVAYPRSRFASMIEAAGLRVQCMEAGYFPGGDRLAGQDLLLLGH